MSDEGVTLDTIANLAKRRGLAAEIRSALLGSVNEVGLFQVALGLYLIADQTAWQGPSNRITLRGEII